MTTIPELKPCDCGVKPVVFGEALMLSIRCPTCSGQFIMGVDVPDLRDRWNNGERGVVANYNRPARPNVVDLDETSDYPPLKPLPKLGIVCTIDRVKPPTFWDRLCASFSQGGRCYLEFAALHPSAFVIEWEPKFRVLFGHRTYLDDQGQPFATRKAAEQYEAVLIRRRCFEVQDSRRS